MTLVNSIHKGRQKIDVICTCHREKQFLLYIFFLFVYLIVCNPNLKENVKENNVRNVKPRFLYIFRGKTFPFTSLAKCENHHEMITQYGYCLLYKHWGGDSLLWWNSTRLLDGRRVPHGTMCRVRCRQGDGHA